MLNWTWDNTAGGHIHGKIKLSFVLCVMISDLIQRRRRRQKDCQSTIFSMAKQIAPDCVSDYLPSFQIQSPFSRSLHLLLHLCVAFPAPTMIAVLVRVPSKTKVQMEVVQVVYQGVEGKYRGACQDAVCISTSSVHKQHQFGVTHFLVLNWITFLKYVP